MLLQPGRNCATIARADRFSVLIDGEAFFHAFVTAAQSAERSIAAVGWDLDYFTDLKNGSELGPFLHELLARRPSLRVSLLSWDYSSLYLRERGLWSQHRRFWRGRSRLEYRLDDAHPVSGAQHQKIIVIDGALAFSGGIDLTQARWDTPEHRPDEPRRRYKDGRTYGPFHDVQAVCSGEAAEYLARVVRTRWQLATGRSLDLGPPRQGLWPRDVAVDFVDIGVAIACTSPAFIHRGETREVQALYEDTIAAAERSLYIENQFLTSEAIGAALERSLAAQRGPEILVVGPSPIGGWFENGTMGVLRARMLARLRAVDRHGRLRVLAPMVAGTPVMLHSKVMIADDRFLRVGSANLSNRSMGLDSECDLAVIAENQAHAAAIRALRGRLLGEHLGADPRECEAPRLFAVLDAHNGGRRCLVPIEDEPGDTTQKVYDSDRPAPIAQAADVLLRGEPVPSVRRPLMIGAGLLALVAALAFAWRFTPLAEWLDPSVIEHTTAVLRTKPLAPVWLTCGFVLASLLMVPVTLLLVQAGVLLGAAQGLVVSVIGVTLSSAIGFLVGRAVCKPLTSHMKGPRWQRLQRMFQRRGALPVAFVRLFPIAPFTVINVVAGASPCSLRSFVIGTLIGMGPGMLALVVFGRGVFDLIVRPSWRSALLVVVVALAAVIASKILRVRLRALRG